MNVYRGIGVSDGVAIGKVLRINSSFVQYPRIELETAEQVPAEIERIRAAQTQVEMQLDSTMEQSTGILSDELNSVFTSYKLFIKDKRFIPAIEKRVQTDRINAEWALIRVITDLQQQFKKVDDPYIRSRFEDIRQLGERLMTNLQQKAHLDLSKLKFQVIIVCHDISPADSFHLARANVLGIVTELGGTTSHSSILARALNIPAVVGVPDITMRVLDEEVIIVDGTSGEIFNNPTDEVINEKLNQLEKISFHQNQLQKLADKDATLADGQAVSIAANLDFMAELDLIKQLHIPSIGLIRTEFMFVLTDTFPDEEQQVDLYSQIIERAEGIPITIRTWDIGGDKSAGAMGQFFEELNPALGLRAIRFCLKHQDMFREQIRAILRVSEKSQINLMIPMVTRIDEVITVKKIISEEKRKLGVSDEKLRVGCMIETPATIFIIDELLDLVDFISIGSNDLIQYALAVDRMNEHVASLYNPFHPSILKMLEQIVLTANRMNKPVSICGELAADPIMQMFLLGVGEITFSMSPNQVLKTKSILKKVNAVACKKIAFQFMTKHSFVESNQYVQQLRSTYLDTI